MADFGYALERLKAGERVQRAGWNGKGMWLAITYTGVCYLDTHHPVKLEPFIVMKTADDKFVPWLASQTDILADDWSVPLL